MSALKTNKLQHMFSQLVLGDKRLANETYEFVNQLVVIERFEYYQGRSEDFLGRGTFGDVFRGRDTGNGKRVSIKRMPISTTAVRELSALPGLVHPHLNPVFAIQQKGIYLYLVGEYSDYSLKKFLFLRGPMAGREMRTAAAQLVSALHHLCRRGLAHLNLKPSNVLVKAKDCRRFTLHLADFGLRRFLEAAWASGSVGTVVYMAPETGAAALLRGPVSLLSEASDVYSLGLVLHECAVGCLPYAEDTALRLFLSAASQEATSPHKRFRLSRLLEDELRDVLGQMLCEAPSQRISVRALTRHPFLTPANVQMEVEQDPSPLPPRKPKYCIIC